MFLSADSQRSLLQGFDLAQAHEIKFYAFVADSVKILFTPLQTTFVAPSGVKVGDIFRSGDIQRTIIQVLLGIATLNALTGESGFLSCSVLRQVKYANQGSPRVSEMLPKDVALLSQLSDRLVLRAWTARIVKTPELIPLITPGKRYAIASDRLGFIPVALIENVVGGTANPDLAWNLALLA